ncbi:MAG: lipoate--protein ligase [Lactobacillus sp.]|jgi:lipoate-protein ligase A|nr:lipoate--protein ligase [Lactobacillus sp.]
MIYIPVKTLDIYHNFALEYYLASEKRFSEPVFLLWSTTPTVMLGKYQDALAELNLEYIRQHQINVVRRYSGGGTIYTDEGGDQFTFIQPDNQQMIDFKAYINTIATALNQMQIPAIATSRNDLTVNDRKISGSAQYKHNGFTVHHGSLLFNTNLEQMYDALHVDNLKLRSKHIASILERTMNIQTIRPDLTNQSFAAELQRHVLATVANLRTYQLTGAELDRIDIIAKEKFADPQFIYGHTPTTELSKKHYFKGGGLVKFDLTVKHGVLTELHLSGDFFSSLDQHTLAKSLLGHPFRPDQVRPILIQQLQQQPILGISADDLLALLFS